MAKVIKKIVLVLFLVNGSALTMFAHFGMIIPSEPVVGQNTNKNLRLVLSFSHPFVEEGMKLEKPERFGVFVNGKKNSLLDSLRETEVMGHKAWEITYNVISPAVHQFYMIPTPYWDSSEDCFIIHYTKLIVPAFGNEEGWNKEIGLKAEIVPLTRPFGLYAGNTFQGIVKNNGKIVPFADVEVNYYNKGKQVVSKNSCLENQSLKSDQNGVFTYTVPASGWWGFKAFVTPDKELKHNGVPKKTYVGAVIWVFFDKWIEKKD
jgi:cobalt/nickel transport protein